MQNLLQDTSFWFLIAFLIFAVIAWIYGRKPAVQKIDSRIHHVRSELDTAENLRVEAQELLAQYQRKKKEALARSEEILSHAGQQAEQARATHETQIEEALKRREQQLQTRIQQAEERAIADIQAYAARLTVKTVEEFMRQQGTAPAVKDSLNQALAKISQDSGQRSRAA